MMLRFTPAVKNLLIINILMLLTAWAVEKVYGYDLNQYLGICYYQSDNFHFYQFITYMFMHADIWHLFFNMYALFIFGTVLENTWGSKRFLIFYFITGVGAALVHMFVNYLHYTPMISDAHAFINTPSPELLRSFIQEHVSDPNRGIFDFINKWSEMPADAGYIQMATDKVSEYITMMVNIPTVGASGAVFGILLGFGMLFPNTQLMLLFPPIPIKAKYFVLIYGAIELYFAVTQPGSAIAHVAHLGGMFFGYLVIKFYSKDRGHFY